MREFFLPPGPAGRRDRPGESPGGRAATAVGRETAQYRLSGTFSDGNSYDLSGLAHWSSSAPDITTIGADGTAIALLDGQTVITATANGRSASLTVHVTEPSLLELTVAPQDAVLQVGQTLSFQATGVFANGHTRDVSTQVVWSSSDSNIAPISLLGEARGVSQGTITISASLNGRTGSTRLRVTPAPIRSLEISPLSRRILVGESLAFSARATFTDGTTGDITNQVVWSVSNPALAGISQGGIALGLAPGVLRVEASLGGVSASTSLTVDVLAFGGGRGGTGNPPTTGQLYVSSGSNISRIADASTADVSVTVAGAIFEPMAIFTGITMDVTRNILYAVDFSVDDVLSYSNPDTGPASLNRLTGMTLPVDVAVGQFGGVSRLFVACSTSETRQLIVIDEAPTANGDYQTIASRSLGNMQIGAATGRPQGISYDAAADRLYVTVDTPAVVVIDGISALPDGTNLSTLGGAVRVITTDSGDDFGLMKPRGCMYEPNSRRLYVADAERGLMVFANADTAAGIVSASAVIGSTFMEASDVFIDANPGRDQVYVADASLSQILVFNSASLLTGTDALAPLPADRTLSGPGLGNVRSLFIDFTR
jgi:hypothetical protein